VGASRRQFLGSVAALLLACRAPDNAPAPVVGRRAPAIVLRSLEGGELTLAALQGRPVIVNFFATWCLPCKNELPALQASSVRHAASGLSFILVDMLEDPDDVAVFLGDLAVTLPAGVDASGEVVKSYRVRGLPSTFFVGRDGVIKQVHLGELDEARLQQGISTIL
jgi:cytochrome c biogenesis protein CcmG/thiol:disulfide interchange protein DsbE